LTDEDAENLVAVRMLHEYYAVTVEVAMDWRSSGRDLRLLMSDEYSKRHGKSAAPGQSKSKSKAKTKAKSKGKSKGR